MTKKIAIMGSEEKYWTPAQRTNTVKKIREILIEESCPKDMLGDRIPFEPDVVTLISGGCPNGGVDIWAEIVADVLGIKKQIFYPDVNQWEDLPHIKQPKEGLNFGFNLFCPRCNAFAIEDGKLGRLWNWDVAPVNNYCKKGYKTRNLEIANTCDVLYYIDPKGRKWSGGRFTMEAARKLGKEVHLVEIE